MKKSLLAVAAMTAFAGAAQAQSSVTVYGILDVGYVGSSYSGLTASATAPSAIAGTVTNPGSLGITTKATTNSFGQSAESSSRIGFKGTEDLGGGTQALFTLEVSLVPNGAASTAALSSTNGAATTIGALNRQTFVGLHKNGVGAATVGVQYTPVFVVQSATDAAGNNNLIGNATYSGSLQSSTGTFNMGLGPYGGPTSYQGFNAVTSAYTTRVPNALQFQSDRIYNTQVTAMYAMSNNNQTASSVSGTSVYGNNNNTLMGIAADYDNAKLKVVAAYQQIKSFDPATSGTNAAASSTMSYGVTSGAGAFGLNMNDNQGYAAATYDFGILKAYVQYINRKVTSTLDATQNAKRSAEQIGVRSQLTSKISAYATYGLGSASYYGTSVTPANFRTMQVGADYFLSKRTNLYAAYGSYNQSSSGGSAAGAYTTSVGASQVGISGSNYAVGIRHTF
jgi:predicted porin